MSQTGKRITMEDVANAAGVGVATVDRVLNKRAKVSPKTAARVLAAAEAFDYHAQSLVRRRIEEMAPARKLGFILQKEEKWFYRKLAEEIVVAAGKLTEIRASVEIQFVGSLSADRLVDAIKDIAVKVDAIGLVAIDHPGVSEAVKEVARSKPVLALLSPLSNPDIAGYIGIDGRKAGRTAGWAMSRLIAGSGGVGLLIGSHRYIGHEALEAGFRSYMRAYSPDVALRDSVIYLDDRDVAYEAASEMLVGVSGLAGIYQVGGGTSGVIRALQETGQESMLTYICHELSPTTSVGLVDGTVDLVVETPIGEIARMATGAMSDLLKSKPARPKLETVAFRLVTPENL